MHENFAAYYERLQSLHNNIGKAISGLSTEALDWVPGPGMNSLAVLVVHLTGAERYWIGDVAGQDPSGRVRSAEFEVHGLEVAELQKRLDQTLVHSRSVLSKLDLDVLDKLRNSPRDGSSYSVAWALAHALEHTALHLGHIQIGRELWELSDQ
ncbi:MAG: DUF664 domain-containing protein [Anaerolineaceae bacterium]|nr:MAG: DUF664 domain-containing protein [Anaerolineaceae bacterium]